MYVPTAFRESDRGKLHALGFGLPVSKRARPKPPFSIERREVLVVFSGRRARMVVGSTG
jgi:hypothetical protein